MAKRSFDTESMAASATPIGFCTSIWMTKKIRLLPRAFQKLAASRGSENSVTKLARPTNTVSPSTRL
ncbi:hypothetical protein D3C73_1301170 [compost metagenome]